jgi:hypothetical protein
MVQPDGHISDAARAAFADSAHASLPAALAPADDRPAA